MKIRRMLVFASSLTAICAGAHDARAQTTAAITGADARHRVMILSDDSTGGRETGSRGDDAAARYVEREFRRLGLEPAGDSGSFFQVVPIVSRRFDMATMSLRAGDAPLRFARDYIALPAIGQLPRGRPRRLDGVEVVYGGALGDTVHVIDSVAARGRFVLLDLQPGAGWRSLGILQRGLPRQLAGAAGIGVVLLDVLPDNYREFFTQPVMRIEDNRRDTAAVIPIAVLSNAAAARFLGRALTGMEIGGAGGRATVRFDLLEGPTAMPARNVVAVLRGSDAARRTSYVSISAHHDHVGMSVEPVDHDSLHAFMREYELYRQASPQLVVTPEQRAGIRVNVDSLHRIRAARPDSIFNGADDDASGTAALLEIAERMASDRARPHRSILFLSHTGEERGLLGSSWFSDHPTVPRDSIIATMDMDMVGRGAARDLAIGGDRYLELIGTRRQSTELGDLIDTLNSRRAMPFRINYAYDAHDHPEGDWCRADHYSLARYGIPAAAFSTSYHGDYHQVTDEAEYLDYPHLAAIAGFVGDLATTIANLDHRLVLDKPKPADPHGRCVQ